MSFNTASAILRGSWFIQKEWADKNMSLVVKMIKGESVDFGMKRDESPDAMVLSHHAGSVYGVGYYTDLSKLPDGSIAMLDIMGPVTKFGDMCSWGSADHTATINRLTKASNISGIIVNVDSPGGQCAGTTMLADAIKAAGAVKPVIGVVDDGIAASAGYWLISACTEVYVTKRTDMVGSVGVYCMIADWYGYFESQGLKVHDVYAPQSKDKNASYLAAIGGEDDALKEELQVLAAEFISTVKANRGDRLTSDEWSTGKMYYAKDAAKIGLIDGIRSMEDVFKRMDTLIKRNSQTNNNTTVMSYPKTQKAAKAEGFQALVPGVATEVASAGVFVPNEAMESIEAAFAENESSASQLTQAQSDLAAANTNLQTANATIATLNTEIAALKAADGTDATDAGDKGKDDFTNKDQSAGDMSFQKDLYSKID